ncbi:MAG: histidine kinase [Deinococcales bacterium]|nr:histidine kinase [Chitinophagaceae bacterium]
MQRILFSIFFFIIFIGKCAAQDTIVFNGQPKLSKGLDIADHCFFYEEKTDKILSFEEVKHQVFVLYKKELRQQRFTNRPLIVQWLKFTIKNTSTTDTLDLHISTVHYFTRLYANDKLVGLSGAYESKKINLKNENEAFTRGRLPIIVSPNTTTTYWFRAEDLQNQLTPPQIILETLLTGLNEEVKSVFAARYLFLLMAAMTGCFFFIGVYALLQYFLYKDKAFLWYIAYTIAAFFSALHWMDIRLGMSLFSPIMHEIIFSVFLYVVPILYSFFIGSMLQLPVYLKEGWLLVKILMGICIVQMMLQFLEVRFGWFPFNPNYYGIFILPLPILLLNIVLLVLTAKSKNPVKWFLFTGILSLILLWCLPLLQKPYAPFANMNYELFLIINFPVFFLLLGLTIEAVCFSFALSYRSKLILVEKNQLQKNYNLELEQALAKRTIELEQQSKILAAQKIKQIETAFEKKIAETEMTALRAQMNPHFIFNCLNSIKLYTLENDSQTASDYLTKFSQLIRLVLENSRSEKVTLQKELETLTLYIELEAMRFKNKVHYQINVPVTIDQQYIEIPPLLLQPYVENAIWHGLMHKTEGGNIWVNVSQPAEYLLHIEIIDDGIGREMAMANKSKSATRQKSFGLKMTAERLEAINHIYQTNTQVTITDLQDADGNTAGTKVTIEIPL